MIPRTAIAQIAKKVGRELNSGAEPSDEALAAGPILAEAGATPQIVALLLAEAQRNRRNDRMIHAYAFLLEGALGTLRVQASGGDVGADHAIAEVHNEVDGVLRESSIAPDVLLLVTRAFARAELDPGRLLQEAMMNAMEAHSPAISATLNSQDISVHFAELAATLDDDPFAIYAELATTAAAFPPEHHAAMAGAIAVSHNDAMREAALGFAFSPNPAVGSAALVAVWQQRGDLVSRKVVDRMVRMRPWFSATRQTDIDTAIRALRPKAAPPMPVKRWEIRGVLASLCDGAGAQSLFALAKQGRRFALACLLVTSRVGVQDAWVRDGMTKPEADVLINQIVDGAEAVEISIDLLEQRLADALAVNVARDVPPPFALLQVAEILALRPLHPESISPQALVEALISDLPLARKNPTAEMAAHRASVRWERKFEIVASWFEAGEAVEELLRPLRTRKRRIEAVSGQLLPARRSFWGERCAWMAATLKESAEDGDSTWSDFALVARDLLGERPLDAIPLATRIASATVDAFEQG